MKHGYPFTPHSIFSGLISLMFVLVLAGCGDDHNVLGGISDEDSVEAQVEEARIALNQGDCQTAINGFMAGHLDNPADIGLRMDLAASYVCRAGFDTIHLLRTAAQFVISGDGVSGFKLFRAIEEGAAGGVSQTWDADTQAAIDILSDPSLSPALNCSIAPFGNDPDVAFNRGIISQIRSFLAVASLQDPANGQITAADLGSIAAILGEGLRDSKEDVLCAESLLDSGTLLGNDISIIATLLNDALNGADGNPANDPTVAEIILFLTGQGYSVI